ncbi:TetR/AcrR family transcriptional regulator [Ruegeria halocynthiae]|uniref:TetR/AcrR family transcriptional regulator n=1 Tax=Ruegeria halocynthiae TaxID=985054 RepID=UPI0015A40238|nr:TetR/AcrR family transcriptional regulator [Ruegeria halocynthiae]
MTKPDGRIKRGEETQSRILQAAIDCIAEFGLGGTTIGRVAERSGVSHSLVIVHFKSKKNLFTAVLRELCEPYEEEWVALCNDEQGDPLDRLMRMAEMELQHASQNPKAIAVWFAYWGLREGTEMYGEIVGPDDLTHTQTLRRLVGEVCVGQSAEQVETIYYGVSSMLWGYLSMVHVGTTPPSPERVLCAIRQFLDPYVSDGKTPSSEPDASAGR